MLFTMGFWFDRCPGRPSHLFPFHFDPPPTPATRKGRGAPSEADGLAVGTLFRSREVAVLEPEDELPPPELGAQAIAPDRPMAAGLQLVDDRCRHIVFELDIHLVVEPPARRIASRLGILLVVRK